MPFLILLLFREHTVKHEFGTNEYVNAIKQQRVADVDHLNNFNWERWLKAHSWLERIQPSGSIGLCRYCNVRMNVEFVYLRKRHETSKGHCDAQRQLEKQASKRKRSASPEDNLNESASKKAMEDSNVMTVVNTSDGGAAGGGVGATDNADPSDWFERLPNTNPQQCRCTLCNCRMAITSFMRHLKTRVHCSNLVSRKDSQR